LPEVSWTWDLSDGIQEVVNRHPRQRRGRDSPTPPGRRADFRHAAGHGRAADRPLDGTRRAWSNPDGGCPAVMPLKEPPMRRRAPSPRRAAALLALAVALLPPGPLTRADEPKEVASFADHTGHPYGLAFSPDGKTLAWAGKDKAVHLYHLPTAKETAKLEHKD